MEFNLGSRAVFQLQQKFNFLNSELDCKKYLSVVNIPTELAGTLYHLYIESVKQQEKNQNEILATVNREDELYARQLVQQDLQAEFGFLKTFNNFNVKLNNKKTKLQPNNVKVCNDNLENNKKEELVEIMLDSQGLLQLENQFGKFNMIPEGFQPVINLPLKLAEKLYSAYIESILIQKKNEEELEKAIAKEERKETKKLKRNEKQSNQTVKESDTLDHDFITVKKKKKPKHNTKDNVVNEAPAGSSKKTAEHYRHEAQKYLEKQQEYNLKAKQAYQKKNSGVAQFYSEMAQNNRLLYDKANEMAVTLFTENENVKQSDTLDLHFFSVKEAMQSLEIFIEAKVNTLKKSKKKFQVLFIIVGRGIHSGNKGSKLGPAVQALLRKRDISFTNNVINPGMLEIKIHPHTRLYS